MAVWGLNVIVVKLLTGMLDAVLVASLRMVVATATLGLLLRNGAQHWPRWQGRTLLLGCVSGFLMVYANQVLFASALLYTSATNVALITALGPFVSGVLESIIFRKRMGRSYMMGVAFALGGVALVILTRPHAQWTAAASGDLLMLASVTAFACGGVAMQRLARHSDPLAISVFVHIVGSVMLLVHTTFSVSAPLAAVLSLGWRAWTMIAFSGILATAFGAVAWGRGIALIGVGKTAAYLSWVPVFGVGFGALLLGESLTPWHFAGVAAVLVGTLLATRRIECI